MIVWREETHRVVAYCGELSVGAIFPGVHRWRWRVWHTVNANPVEGVTLNSAAARAAVEDRFECFVKAAGLIMAESAG
ncbi:MAG: hypothetical protein J0G28_14535 [Afipia sp.]|nr:hypothetical protein [Afipia sp.]